MSDEQPITLAAHRFLDERGIAYERATFPATTDKGAANVAAALGFRARQMIKTLIFVTGDGERVLVMLGGDQNARSSLLKQAIGSRNIKLADAETVQATTGYAIGSIPPWGWQPPGFRSFIDAALLDEPLLGVGAGQWGHEILIAPQELVAATHATVVDLTGDTLEHES